MEWNNDMTTAPKGGGAGGNVTDPDWIEPPQVLLWFAGGEIAVCRWDWYYAEGGSGYNGISAWVEPVSGELIALHYDEPTHWMLPDAPCNPA